MRVLAVVHMYPPQHNAGAEWMLHSILRRWVQMGDDVHVVHPNTKRHTLDGVKVAPLDHTRLTEQASKADLLVTHLDLTTRTLALSRETGTPVLHLVHNHQQLHAGGVTTRSRNLVAFNSEWLAARYRWKGPHTICRPHVRVADYETTPGSMVTLVNLNRDKGVRLLHRLASIQREREFLGVTGAYGQQNTATYPNLDVMATTANMRDDVYARTRVLLMPSRYESWGRCAIEAACSGIPTIAAPTPGLRESLGDAGIFSDVRDAYCWAETLDCLDNAEHYAVHSKRAWERARELEAITAADVDALHGWCEERV